MSNRLSCKGCKATWVDSRMDPHFHCTQCHQTWVPTHDVTVCPAKAAK